MTHISKNILFIPNSSFKNYLPSRKVVLHFKSTFFTGGKKKKEILRISGLFCMSLICPQALLKNIVSSTAWRLFSGENKYFSCDLCSHLIHLSTCKLLKKEIGIFCSSDKLRQSSFWYDGWQNKNGDAPLLGSYAEDLRNPCIVQPWPMHRLAHKAGITVGQLPWLGAWRAKQSWGPLALVVSLNGPLTDVTFSVLQM